MPTHSVSLTFLVDWRKILSNIARVWDTTAKRHGMPLHNDTVCTHCTNAIHRTMPPYIPGEITDLIISFVAHADSDIDNPTAALWACALVCREWLPASRRHLFEDVYLTEKAYKPFITQVVYSETMRPWLASTYHLRMEGFDGRPCVPIYELSGRLPNLRSLSLFRLDWSAHMPLLKEYVVFSQFSRLQSLSIYHCTFSSFASLRRMFTALPSLHDLSMWFVHVANVPTVAPPVPVLGSRSRPALSSLAITFDVSQSWISTFLGWLSDTQTRTSMRELVYRLQYSPTPAHQEHTRFFEQVASSITHLDITMFSPQCE